MLTRDQIEELCPVVFGGHRWHWNETPVLVVFNEASGAHEYDTYERVCRACSKYEVFYAPEGAP